MKPKATAQEQAQRRASKTPKKKWPKLGRHSSGAARATFNGRVHYFGDYGPPGKSCTEPETMARYAAHCEAWDAAGRRPPAPAPHAAQAMLTVAELFEEYRRVNDSKRKYTKRGEPTSQRHLIDKALDQFAAYAGSVPVCKLGEATLVGWREGMEADYPTLTRGGINRKAGLVLAAIKWGKKRGLVPKHVWADVEEFEPLARGECGERPEGGKEKVAVPFDVIERVAAAAERVSRHVAAMMRIQALTGMRPGEACALRWCDIDKKPEGGKGISWLYTVAGAKSDHHGKPTVYWLKPQAQAILAEFPATPASFIFSPRASMDERRKRLREARVTPLKPSVRRRDEARSLRHGDRWGGSEYRQAVQRACRAAGVEPFGPHAIRHRVVTAVAKKYGVVAAQRVANHSSVKTTAGYVHAEDGDALEAIMGLQSVATT